MRRLAKSSALPVARALVARAAARTGRRRRRKSLAARAAGAGAAAGNGTVPAYRWISTAVKMTPALSAMTTTAMAIIAPRIAALPLASPRPEATDANILPTAWNAGPRPLIAPIVLWICAKVLYAATPIFIRLCSRYAAIQDSIVMISPVPSAGKMIVRYQRLKAPFS